MFGIKFVRYPAFITYLCHMYLITTFKILYICVCVCVCVCVMAPLRRGHLLYQLSDQAPPKYYIYRISANISDVWIFLLPNIGIGIGPNIPYQSGPRMKHLLLLNSCEIWQHKLVLLSITTIKQSKNIVSSLWSLLCSHFGCLLSSSLSLAPLAALSVYLNLRGGTKFDCCVCKRYWTTAA